MKRFNVMVRVLDLVEAETPEEAAIAFRRCIEAQGFSVYEPVALAQSVLEDVFEVPVPPGSADPLEG